eukprot:CAMPEP_0170605416 /NCGR_PEP_ID=MMETSP0224-20130122/19963_1 /TAXON_ID=285029 /ORGANISM="Togula jolla, Strain CCCM 725" /LENGTH=370 /DNA_ID=CAMNT_0010930421 /DNA_START=67 /DNA_END=1179 /DNA_ORIENTATION=+
MSDLETVVAVLADCAEYPSTAAVGLRAMLADGLPEVVDVLDKATTTAEREVPHELLQMVAMVLRSASGCCVEVLKEREVQVAEASALCDAGDARHSSSRATLEEARDQVTLLSSQLQAARETAAEEQSNHADVEAETKHILESQAILEKELALARQMAVLVQDLEAGVSEKALPSMVDAVLGYLVDNGAEPALQVAARSALQRLPAERQSFDVITLETIKGVLAEWQAHSEEKLATSAPTVEGARAEALGAWAILALARGNTAELEEAHAQAEQALETAASAYEKAQADVSSLRKALSDRLVEQTLTEAKAAEINEASAAVLRLADVTPPPTAAADTVPDVKMTEDSRVGPALVDGRRVATAGAGQAKLQ